MKYVLVLSSILATSAFAQGVLPEVDYVQCQRAVGFMGPQLNSFGEFDKEATGMLPAPDVETKKTEAGGSRMTYTYKTDGGPWNKGKPIVSTYIIEKDKDGKLTKIISGGDKMDKHQVQMHKQMMIESSSYTGVPMGGLTNDPMMTVSLNGQGFYQTPLSKLDTAEAKKFGVDMDELRKLRSEKRKDNRVMKKLRDGYTKLFDKAPLMIPNGTEVEVEIKDGACGISKVSQRAYDPKSKANQVTSSVSRERCDAVNNITKKYEKQLQSCAMTNMQMNQELFALNAPTGVTGGYVGGAVGGINGGVAGGYVGGAVGGIAGGMNGGMYGGGLGLGGYGYPGAFHGQGMDSWQCQMYFADSSYVQQMGSSKAKKSTTIKVNGASAQ